MSALTFESFASSARRNPSRRVARPVNKLVDPQLQAAQQQAAIESIRERNSSISKGNKGAISALVVATVILHIVILNSFNREGQVEPISAKPAPVEIELAPPPPPPPEPPKPIEKVKPQPAPAKLAPNIPVVRSDVPIDNTPSPDAVQVAPAPPPVVAAAPAPAPEPVTEPRGFAGYLNNPAATYPPQALLKRIQGRVILNVHVLASGRADEVTVFKTSGERILDDSAVKTVASWLFDPAKRGNTPIDGWVKVPVNFKIS